MPVGTARIVESWLKELDQQKLDDWVAGRISVKDRVGRLIDSYKLLAKSSKWAILRWLEGLSGKGIYDWLREKRPDLHLGEEGMTVSRIDADLLEVRKLVESL